MTTLNYKLYVHCICSYRSSASRLTRNIRIPFEHSDQATVALESLLPDPELKPDQLAKKLSVDGSELVADFRAVTDRVLRVGVNSFMDNLALLVECIEELNVEALEGI